MQENIESKYQQSDPRYHTANIKAMLNDTIKHVREDVGQVTDPKAQALFEDHSRGPQRSCDRVQSLRAAIGAGLAIKES